jgi:Skp family chaperone for outer membrane proteins
MTIDSSRLGWLVAAALGGVLATVALSGFQANTAPKFATVDVEKVFDESKLRQTNSQTLEDAQRLRANVFSFIAQNPAMNTADAKKYSELAVKASPTAADTTELARLKAAGEDATRQNSALSTKPSLSDAEKKQVEEFGAQTRAKQAFLARLESDYQAQLQDMQRDLHDKTLDRVTEVVKGIAAKQGYTVVFNTSSAPYAANDLTADAMKALK